MERNEHDLVWRKRGSIFRTVFIVLLLFLLLMLGYMTVYTSQVTARKNRKDIDASALDHLEQTSHVIDQQVEALEEKANMVMYESDWVNYMFRSDRLTSDQGYHILQILAHITKEGNEDGAWFYSQRGPYVFSASGYRVTKEESDLSELIRYHENRQDKWRWLRSDMKTDLFRWGDDLYVAVDFAPSASVGTFLIRLDSEKVDETFRSSTDTGTILVYDADGVCIYPDSELGTAMEEDDRTFYEVAGSVRQGRQKRYRVTSELTGWSYVLPIDTDASVLTLGEMVRIMLPCLLVLILLGITCSYLITREIYEPIEQLMYIAGAGTHREKNHSLNEVDYLVKKYRENRKVNQELQETLSQVSAEMREQLCRKLIFGRSLSREYRDTMIQMTGIGSLGSVRYQVIAIELQARREVLQSQVESNLFLMGVQNLLASQEGHLATVVSDDWRLAGVFFWPEDMSVLENRQRIRDIQELLEKEFQSLPCRIQVMTGHMYTSIEDIRYSWQEAEEQLRYRQYMETESREVSSAEEQDRANAVESEFAGYDSGRILVLLESAAGGRAGEARLALKGLLKEIFSSEGTDPAQTDARCMQIRDMMIEKLLDYRMDKEENQTMLDSLEFKGGSGGSATQWESYFEQVLNQIALCSGKKQYQYVEMAQKYITEHFSESQLTVNDVSDHIGIHVSYFSSLFNSIAGESFSSYLNKVRVEHARDMLAMTKVSVRDVGFKCGFNTVQTFGRVFKKQTGMSPGQYRDSVRSADSE